MRPVGDALRIHRIVSKAVIHGGAAGDHRSVAKTLRLRRVCANFCAFGGYRTTWEAVSHSSKVFPILRGLAYGYTNLLA